MAGKWNTDEDIAPIEKKVSVVGIVVVLILPKTLPTLPNKLTKSSTYVTPVTKLSHNVR